MDNFGAEGLSGVIGRLGERLIGMDPRPVKKITAFLHGPAALFGGYDRASTGCP